MDLQRGERQTQRTKEALEMAFAQLIREKGYQTITISDITKRANTGRSTFYRHFQTKADLLLSLHADIFGRLSLGLDSPTAWLAAEPPPQLVDFLEQFRPDNSGRPAFGYKLGRDVDYVLSKMDELLAHQFETSLRCSFLESKSTIPFDILAQSIAGTYSWLIRTWFTQRRTLTPAQVAGYIHRLTRAAVREAFDEKL